MASLPLFPGLVKLGPLWGRQLLGVAGRLGISADELAATIHIESGGDPRALSPGGRVGLIQWGKLSAGALGFTPAEVREMGAVPQLDLVERTLKPYRTHITKPGDVRLAVFSPAALDWADDEPLSAAALAANGRLDANQDGKLTAGEIRAQGLAALAGRARWELGDGAAVLPELGAAGGSMLPLAALGGLAALVLLVVHP